MNPQLLKQLLQQKEPAKDIKYGKEARALLAEGADKLAQAVITTLGPTGANVVLDREFPAPHVVHDGVTVAKEIRLLNSFENMGAALIREAATKTNSLAGDGTTTAILLANTLIQAGIEIIDGGNQDTLISNKYDKMKLKDELLQWSEIIVGKLAKRAKKLKTLKEKESIATISSQMPKIGQIVARAIEKVGDNGLIMVEESGLIEDELELQEGFNFDNGFLSPYFVTDEARMIASYQDAYLLLTDHTVANAMELMPIVTDIFEGSGPSKPLIIIANDIVGPAIKALIATKVKLGHPIIGIVAPEFGERRKQLLEDMALLFGGVVISSELGMALKDVKISDLGRVRNAFITQHQTQLTPQNPDKEEIAERAQEIKQQIKEADNDFIKNRLEERLSKLTQAVAVIRVGGGSDTEMKEKKERIIDAVHATKAAIEEGIVPGGGVALKDILVEILLEEKEVTDGSKLITQMLLSPIMGISGYAKGDTAKWPLGMGLNVKTGEIVDMIEQGIVDPVKVTRLAVTHAISVASMILTAECAVTDHKEEEEK